MTTAKSKLIRTVASVLMAWLGAALLWPVIADLFYSYSTGVYPNPEDGLNPIIIPLMAVGGLIGLGLIGGALIILWRTWRPRTA